MKTFIHHYQNKKKITFLNSEFLIKQQLTIISCKKMDKNVCKKSHDMFLTYLYKTSLFL